MDIIAHRGASADAPEHTWAAYDLALAQGADALEIDVRMLADGRLVALHDATLWRTAGDPRAAATLTHDELRQIPKPHRPLRLARILERYADRAWFLLDLKQPTPAMERRVATLVRRLQLRDVVVVQSFDARSMRRLAGRVTVSPLFQRRPSRRALDQAVAIGASDVAVRGRDADPALLAAATAHGLGVRAWTINDPAEAAVLAARGVEGLITDRPAVVRPAVGGRRALVA